MYIVSLVGNHVFKGSIVVCTIKRISNLDKIRIYIKQKYGVEFEELSAQFTPSWWKFDNITDNRDISLIIETAYTEEDIDKFLS